MSEAFTSARIDGKVKPVESGKEDQYYLDKTLHLWQETTDGSFNHEPGFGETAVFPATEQREPSTDNGAERAGEPAPASNDRTSDVQRMTFW